MKSIRFTMIQAMLILLSVSIGHAHDIKAGGMYAFTKAAVSSTAAHAPKLILEVTDKATGKPVAARFSVTVDGHPYEPPELGPGGLKFESIHERKQQRFVACYTRGEKPVEVLLPVGARRITVYVTKGFEYLPITLTSDIHGSETRLSASLERWSNIREDGWYGTDEHVHYDRLEPAGDTRWLTMMDGDDLACAHFMTLKGGMRDGCWALQYAFGKEGQSTDGERLIVPGEEYRDTAQGHINLLGLTELIEPISTGGMGIPKVRENYPPFIDVLRETQRQGGMGGVAHGAKLGLHPTAIMDAVLGAVDFWEISNGFIYQTDLWYKLMNCGYFLPPAAGTDLPNDPERDPWQPFLGSVRTYVRTGDNNDFETWKTVMKRGEVFITGGPLIQMKVNSAGPGGTIHLPAGGGEVMVEAELTSPRQLQSLEIMFNGKEIRAEPLSAIKDRVHTLTIKEKVHVTKSGWFAAAGQGSRIEAQQIDALAHTGAIRVLVGNQPIKSSSDASALIEILEEQKHYYSTKGRFQQPEHRERMLNLYDQAIKELRK